MKRVFFDLDGVLADFEKGVSDNLDKMFEKHFFRNLLPMEEDIDEIVQQLQKQGFEVHILTKLPVKRSDRRFKEMMMDKVVWIFEHAPSVDELNIHILPCNEDKSTILDFYEDKERCILIDDYTPNLASWIGCGGKGIKKAKRFKDTRVVSQILSIKEIERMI